VNRKINAGIACSDRANEVEPRPNEVPLTVIASAAKQSRILVINFLDCFSRASFAMTINGYVFNLVNLVNPINHGSDNMLDCFAALAMTVKGYVIVSAATKQSLLRLPNEINFIKYIIIKYIY
jgi:hypothetical protein